MMCERSTGNKDKAQPPRLNAIKGDGCIFCHYTSLILDDARGVLGIGGVEEDGCVMLGVEHRPDLSCGDPNVMSCFFKRRLVVLWIRHWILVACELTEVPAAIRIMKLGISNLLFRSVGAIDSKLKVHGRVPQLMQNCHATTQRIGYRRESACNAQAYLKIVLNPENFKGLFEVAFHRFDVRKDHHCQSAGAKQILLSFAANRLLVQSKRDVEGDEDRYNAAYCLNPCRPVTSRCLAAGWIAAHKRPNEECSRDESHNRYNRPISIGPSLLHGIPLLLCGILPIGLVA
jgi:hypothetical protein